MTSTVVEPQPIHIGVLASEPVRVAGLASIFDLPMEQDQARLNPIIGSMPELLGNPTIKYLVVDLQSRPDGLDALEEVRRARPNIRSIVIGPDEDDDLVVNSIIAGARAYLGQDADPEVIRKAIEVVTSGSIWAPRRLLCRVIDRLLKGSNVTQVTENSQLTPREEQVLELILGAHSTREIAARLGIEQRTVKAYVGRLMRKTGSDNRIKLSMSALKRSLVPRDVERRGGAGAVQ